MGDAVHKCSFKEHRWVWPQLMTFLMHPSKQARPTVAALPAEACNCRYNLRCPFLDRRENENHFLRDMNNLSRASEVTGRLSVLENASSGSEDLNS